MCVQRDYKVKILESWHVELYNKQYTYSFLCNTHLTVMYWMNVSRYFFV